MHPPTTATPLVTVRPVPDTDDTGPRHVVVVAGMDGPAFATPALAALYADQLGAALAAALAPLLALADRATQLRADPTALDRIQARTVSPRSALLRALRWILDGEGGEVLRGPAHGEEADDADGPPSPLRPRDEPAGLDRLITAAGAAIVCGEEGSTDGE